jgi:hypothetical protein
MMRRKLLTRWRGFALLEQIFHCAPGFGIGLLPVAAKHLWRRRQWMSNRSNVVGAQVTERLLNQF